MSHQSSGTFPLLQQVAHEVADSLKHRTDVESARVRLRLLEVAAVMKGWAAMRPSEEERRRVVDELFSLAKRGQELAGKT